jgi:ornithine cyclodeaminase
MNIPHFSYQRVAELLRPADVVRQLDLAFADLARGEAAIHPRQRSECGGIKLSSMGALWPAQSVGGLKIYPTVAGRFSFAGAAVRPARQPAAGPVRCQ